jgi:hypothetical protein
VIFGKVAIGISKWVVQKRKVGRAGFSAASPSA